PGLRQHRPTEREDCYDDRAKPVIIPPRSKSGERPREMPLRHKEAAAQRLRQSNAGEHFVARMIEILAHGKWLPWLREHREVATPTETPLDTIGDALCRTADAARCWEV